MDISANTYIKVEDEDDMFQNFEDRRPPMQYPSSQLHHDHEPRSGPDEIGSLDFKAPTNASPFTNTNTHSSTNINTPATNSNTRPTAMSPPDMRSYVAAGHPGSSSKDMYQGGCPIKIPDDRSNATSFLMQSPQGNQRGRPASHVDRFIHDNINSAGSFSSLGSSIDTFYSSEADDLAPSEPSPQPSSGGHLGGTSSTGLLSPGLAPIAGSNGNSNNQGGAGSGSGGPSATHRPFGSLGYGGHGYSSGGSSGTGGGSGSGGLGHSKALSMPVNAVTTAVNATATGLSGSPRKYTYGSGAGINKNRNSISGPSSNLSSGNLSGNVSASGAVSPRVAAGTLSGLGTSAPSTSSALGGGDLKFPPTSSSTTKPTVEDRQQLLLERRRRRRESHNAVERRRRDNINEKIKELSELVPEQFLLAAMETGVKSGTADDRPNKGTILARSVDYIRLLQQIIDRQNHVEVEFQELVNKYQVRVGEEPTAYHYTSAEVALREAGMFAGPFDGQQPHPRDTPQSIPHQNLQQFRQPDFGYSGGEDHNNSSSLSHALLRTKLDNSQDPHQHSSNIDAQSEGAFSPGYRGGGSDVLSPTFDLDYINHASYLKHNEHAIDDDYGY